MVVSNKKTNLFIDPVLPPWPSPWPRPWPGLAVMPVVHRFCSFSFDLFIASAYTDDALKGVLPNTRCGATEAKAAEQAKEAKEA